MDYRLTIEERNQIALQLREFLLQSEDPNRLRSIEEESCQPHEKAQGIYAFEFFIDRFRKNFSKTATDIADYNIGWSNMSIRMDEQGWSLERMIRMSTEVFMSVAIERGSIDITADSWQKAELSGQTCIEFNRIKLFVYELMYELARELSRSRAADLGYK